MRDHCSLLAWQVADQIAVEVYRIATENWTPALGPAWDQVRRSSLSTALNIAEGYRWRPGPRWRFHLRVANGSALETSEVIRFLCRLDGIEASRGTRLLQSSVRCERLVWGLLRHDTG